MENRELLQFAISIGEIMLKSGAETSRVEDTIERILHVKKGIKPEVFVVPTGIFASIETENANAITNVRRISSTSLNLEKVALANSLSRKFVEKKITLKNGFEELEKIKSIRAISLKSFIISNSLISFSSTLMFKGTFVDSLISFFVGIMLGAFCFYLSKVNISGFLSNFISGGFVAFFVILISYLMPSISYDATVVGCLMPLVPGVAITNAVRDIINKDYLSGACRILEASVVAIAIATGVGTIFSIFNLGGI